MFFSAQFGGRDAAESTLPSFRRLKDAAAGVEIVGFPYPELAFVLRVDGDIQQFSLSGLGDVEGCEGDYYSIDLGITQADQQDVDEALLSALLTCPDFVRHRGLSGYSQIGLETAVSELCVRFRQAQ